MDIFIWELIMYNINCNIKSSINWYYKFKEKIKLNLWELIKKKVEKEKKKY